MTKDELKAIEELRQIALSLKTFKTECEQRIATTETKIQQKHLPITLEQDILRAAQTSIGESIKTVLTKYDSPLTKLVESVVNENSSFLRGIISDSFNQVIRTEDFKAAIVSSFSHKVAKAIISGNDSMFGKVCNDLKQDPVFKAKMVLATTAVVEECLTKSDKIGQSL